LSRARRKNLVESESNGLSIKKQCKLLDVPHSSFYYTPASANNENLDLMCLIDKQFLETPWYGSRQLVRHFKREGIKVNRKRIKRLMRLMGIMPIYQKPRTSIPNPEHKIYPYLLRNLKITNPNQVWCSDITYIPMPKGFMYCVAIMDWFSRKVLSWRLSNTMDSDFCVDALKEAINKYGTPEIFNTDQGSQFSSIKFQKVLSNNNIKISMDGKGRWRDNVMIERLWRSLKYECVYLRAFESGTELKFGISQWINYYNAMRPHSSLGGMTPNEIFSAPPPGAGMLQAA